MTTTAGISVDHKPDTVEKKNAWRRFADVSRLHITAIAAMGVFTFGWLFIGVYPWLLAAVCALDWYIVNLINRTVDLKEDRANIIFKTDFVDRNRRLLQIAALMVLLISLVVVHFLNPAITVLRIVCHLLGAFYNWPLLPGKRRLKQLCFWKNNASAIGFLITVFGYPLATIWWGNGSHRFPPGITWPTVVFSAVFFYLFDRVPWRIFIMIAAPFLQFVVYKQALRRGISEKDCIRITWMGVAMFFIYHIWVIAELPGAGL